MLTLNKPNKRYIYCVIGNSKLANPTLLHLSCRYGLINLTGSLLDMRSHELALSMLNNNGKRPEELAEINGHKLLVEDIQAVSRSSI